MTTDDDRSTAHLESNTQLLHWNLSCTLGLKTFNISTVFETVATKCHTLWSSWKKSIKKPKSWNQGVEAKVKTLYTWYSKLTLVRPGSWDQDQTLTQVCISSSTPWTGPCEQRQVKLFNICLSGLTQHAVNLKWLCQDFCACSKNSSNSLEGLTVSSINL